MAKSTFMYWQKRFNRENPDKDMEEKNKEQLKHFVVIFFKIIFIFSSLIENTDEEKKAKFS